MEKSNPLGDLLVRKLFTEDGVLVDSVEGDELASRLAEVLVAVVNATGPAGRAALEAYCKSCR